MIDNNKYDVIIIGGSYAGFSAAMALGRSLRKVLIIDSGKPCNHQTPYSHNFITHDGKKPSDINAKAKKQVLKYSTITFLEAKATKAIKTENDFEIETEKGETFTSRKLLFTTGLKDIFPEINGFAECWGISILHCPYCHGYEVKNEKTGIVANGDIGYEFTKMISNWTKNLTVFTNGKPTLTEEQIGILKKNNITVVENEIDYFQHNEGKLMNIVFKNGTKTAIKALYAKPPFEQHSLLPQELGCEITEQGLIKVDSFQKTTVAGIYAAGDNSTFGRSLALAVSSGSVAGALINKELIEEDFV
ncbi:NAD(P)/FAD-dependent oxidoreductase [Flavobacterium hydatis]|uniref:Pyridine nucleotide-disulfide oxidoreductase n=1 Tax=Flavobacterium hydatis TaxID=991 RepID=A0A086ARY2_FLAHY|nr:NAD(P)/FAD-dependent oxidoreductase [Flavobacterium hydatis]KFF19446.1 pyridine nucleotide-disulfide oxidoreductase [Flavobacterium hydatis]OXA96425.1 pyridine nucleotide-disulfide oxidoreductase [Flavobacterium hydatis]